MVFVLFSFTAKMNLGEDASMATSLFCSVAGDTAAAHEFWSRSNHGPTVSELSAWKHNKHAKSQCEPLPWQPNSGEKIRDYC